MAFRYDMSPTGKAFHECDKYVKMLCGPYGSGTVSYTHLTLPTKA